MKQLIQVLTKSSGSYMSVYVNVKHIVSIIPTFDDDTCTIHLTGGTIIKVYEGIESLIEHVHSAEV